MTQNFKEEQYKKELEKKQAKLEAALKEAEKVRQYREIQAAVEAVDDILNKLAIFDKISSESELDQAMPDLLAIPYQTVRIYLPGLLRRNVRFCECLMNGVQRAFFQQLKKCRN